MYNYALHKQINKVLASNNIDAGGADIDFYTRLIANAAAIQALYYTIYAGHTAADELFDEMIATIVVAHNQRSKALKQKDAEKQQKDYWFLSNKIAGMSLYVDRFCGSLKHMPAKLGYLKNTGINLLHLMPVFESPAGESDGGYAVSNYRKVDERFGTIEDLLVLQEHMQAEDMYLVVDIVLNHTSHKHEWAEKAKQGDKKYQDFYYMYSDRTIPDSFERTMPEIFPESAPGSFTWSAACNKWVMTVFHNYQWDLNYTNPAVFVAMLDNILFYANIGVDILRIDAPAFIWKALGTTCQNLPKAHTILQLIRQCVQAAAPGMALLGEAIVAPKDILPYFGTGKAAAQECDVAYNATQMALQWDMLATGDTRVMYAAQYLLLQKPYGATWITYTRCHDDIGLGYDDSMIAEAGYSPYEHRKFLKEYYSGQNGSPARGALFSVNPKSQDARISGSLASLCGLEKALGDNDDVAIKTAIKKILLMQAHSFFLGGIPMLFYGDEAGYTNNYSYLQDATKSYDNRWMHRPIIDWQKNGNTKVPGTVEYAIFTGTQQLLALRKRLDAIADLKNITWLHTHNKCVAGFIRYNNKSQIFCLFNFSSSETFVAVSVLSYGGKTYNTLYDNFSGKYITESTGYFAIEAYGFYIIEGH